MRLYRLNKLEKENMFVYHLCRILRYFFICLQNFIFELGAWFRKCGVTSKEYAALRALNDSHKDEKCFVIATGPSLTLDDVEKLKGYYTFGMNAVCKLYEKTDWRPSFYGIQDENVYESLFPILVKEKNKENIFVSSNIAKQFPNSKVFMKFPLNSKYNYFDFRYSNKLHVKFCKNAYSKVYDAYSITFSLLQIAIYMGFKEIYLLGCDCNQKVGQKNHFVDFGHVESDEKLATSKDRNIFSHGKFKEFADAMGVKVFNATRGGQLEVYPRVNLDDVIR